MTHRPLRRLCLALLVALAAALGPAALSFAESAPPAEAAPTPAARPASEVSAGERRLGARLLAPCCWTQTLDVHESPLASALRLEIGQRLAAGEASEGIEDDLAARFGERVRAAPRGKDPLVYVAAFAVLWAVFSGLGALSLLRRWVRRSASRAPAVEAVATVPDEYDALLDEELRRLGDA